MAKTLLNLVNEVLKKVDVLDEDTGVLTSLTDSARQTYIDLAVQLSNETIDELFSLSAVSKPMQLKASTITLVTAQQSYALRSDLVTLRREYRMVDESNNQFIDILGDDGYRQLILGDAEQDDTGLPHFAAISPIDSKLWLDRAPTAAENGKVYKYRFDRDLELTDECDQVPFTNPVFRAVVPAVAELWRFNRHKEFSQGLLDSSMGRAARLFSKIPPRSSYAAPRGGVNITDPMQSA